MTVHDAWLGVLDKVLRPARRDLEWCIREGEVHREARRRVVRERDAELAHCAARIERARAAVFAADDGAVPRLMTDLEREWLTLSRTDVDGELMDLWARMAPRSWHDRKHWRDSAPAAQLDAAMALASDVLGVEAAEREVASLRSALAAWGVRIGTRIRWRAIESETECVTGLLAEPLVGARAALAAHPSATTARARSERTRRAVHDAACARFPRRPLLAEGLAHAAFVDALVHAAGLVDRPNPVTPLRALWMTGYTLAQVGAEGVTLEIPPL
jgi:hypothetical protein